MQHIAALFPLLVSAVLLQAQPAGSLGGSILDPSGSAVPGAIVTLQGPKGLTKTMILSGLKKGILIADCGVVITIADVASQIAASFTLDRIPRRAQPSPGRIRPWLIVSGI
jgi:hypothetical protein